MYDSIFFYYKTRAVYLYKILLKMQKMVTTVMTTKEVLELAHDKGLSLLLIKLFCETSQLHAQTQGSTCSLHAFNVVLASGKIMLYTVF